ncbi:hypothetical protein BH18ACT2_BH18ACT2_05830 [soil metagenome]
MVNRSDPVRTWESARELVGTEPPTDDDVPITIDGRRLDTPEKVIAFIDEINERRSVQDRRAG